MKVAVNTRFLLKDRLEGIGWFTYETLKRITQAHPEHDFFFIFDRAFDQSFIFSDNVHPIVVGPPARHPFLWYWWFELSIPKVLKQIKADVFLSTDGFASLSTNVPTLTVIHDLAFEHFDNHHGWLVKNYLRKFTPKFAAKSERIVTVSEYSKQDIHELYHVDLSHIDVTYNGVNTAFKPLSELEKQAVKKQYTNGIDYLVYAGSIHPRKNVVRLLQAFDQFKTKTGADTKLVLAGAQGWKTGAAIDTLNNLTHKADVVMTGHLTAEKLVPVIAAAQTMMYVSLFEGFGIPIIEAMRCGVPVITSNVTSMPEVATDAAIAVNPNDVDAIAEAIADITTNDSLRNDLITKGLERSANFNWDKTANQLWESLKKVTDL